MSSFARVKVPDVEADVSLQLKNEENKAGTRSIVANRALVRCGRAGASECAHMWVADARLSPSRALEYFNQTLYSRFPP